MKREMLVLISIVGLGYAQRWVSLDPTQPSGTPPSVEVLSSSQFETRIRISIPGM